MFVDSKAGPAGAEDQSVHHIHPWRILMVDDEVAVHMASKLVLRRVTFGGRPLEIVSAYSAHEAMQLLHEDDGYAVALIDVVMESEHAGLELVNHIRREIGNANMRIVLRTGHPGSAPEREVIIDYEIDDYKEKTELTAERLFTTVYAALRSYRNIVTLKRTKDGLERIIDAASNIFVTTGYMDFVCGMLVQITAMIQAEMGSVMLRGAIAAREHLGELEVIAGTGNFESLKGQKGHGILPEDVTERLRRSAAGRLDPIVSSDGLLMFIAPQNTDNMYIWIPLTESLSEECIALLRLFALKFALGLDNIMMQQESLDAQGEVIDMLCGLIEQRSLETGNHIRRVAMLSRLLAEKTGIDPEVVELIEAAAPLHDIGKIAIPDSILNKPGRLTEDERDRIRYRNAAEMFGEAERTFAAE